MNVKLSKKKEVLFYIIMFAIPVIIIAGLEAGLRIAGYGTDYPVFIELDESPGQYFFNPEFPEKYFTAGAPVPSVIPDPFDINKKENTIRIFVLGGSTTAGYPYPPNVSFPSMLKRKLELYYPGTRFEVINMGVSAVNSYFVNDILDDVLDMQPDYLLFYMGHNEYYGSPGPASTQVISGSPLFVRLMLSLRETRLYQLMSGIISESARVTTGDKKSKTLMGEMISEKIIPYGSDILKTGMKQFRDNLEQITEKCRENGVPFYIGKLVSNLEQKPLDRGATEATEIYNEAAGFLASGDTTEARYRYRQAKDRDALRFRAPEILNYMIVGVTESNERVATDSLFAASSKNGITGYSLMTDHLHPNIEGYALMADGFFETLEKDLEAERVKGVPAEDIEKYLTDNMPVTRFDSAYADIKLKVLLNNYPFTENDSYSIEDYEPCCFADSMAKNTLMGKIGWSSARLGLFDFYLSAKKYDRAFSEAYALLEARPFFKSALYNITAKLMNAGRTEDAKHLLVKNHRRYPDAFTAKYLGIINLNEGRLSLAEKLLEEAAGYDAGDPQVWFLLSKSRYGQKDIDGAVSALEKCLRKDPSYPGATEVLAQLKKDRSVAR